MNDDTFDEEEVETFKRYLIAETAFKKLIKEGLTPMEAFGVILGMVANQLATLQDTDWPDDPPKKRNHLRVVK
jgi:tRNA(His) 5'-end guanylyltransferase